ncbi:Crp/Fnr family transcriptional regulator [Flavobacteriales bacterium]|jgi:CRP-like cAMP-binding protein|nr:Crp/Fnr family transcriptional regulator [Flavobacteriales bacterium]MDA9262254.1 Crp/Fnr family transcriptional regulator [bacterium]
MELIKFLDENKLWKETKTYKRNEFIKRKNSVDTNLYFVVEGSLRVFILYEDEEKVIRFGYKNSLITALDSFLTGEPSLFNIQVIKKTIVKVISKDTFDQLLKVHSFINDIWIKNLELLALQQIEREIDILTNSPKERYLRVLKRSPNLFQEIPNKHIASYLRMSPETLSRMKKH